ncbi:MAG: hypothetical protein FJX22_02355, partial [Alphaproteobacteria bacterium]|nr:hypothetical protein [Alphaproteobacteria bacterium]
MMGNNRVNDFCKLGLRAMNNLRHLGLIALLMLLFGMTPNGGISSSWASTQLGSNLKLYKPSKVDANKPPANKGNANKSGERPLVLLFSPKTGWSQETETVARQFHQLGYGVVGIDSLSFMRLTDGAAGQPVPTGNCSALRQQASALAQQWGQQWQQPNATPPILAGLGEGATLVHQLLRTAPAGQFAGGVGLSYCPNARLSRSPCEGVEPNPMALNNPWLVVNAPRPADCQVVDYEKSAARPFKKVRLLELDSVTDDWQPLSSWRNPLKTNLQWLLSQTTKPSYAQVQELDGLALVETPAAAIGYLKPPMGATNPNPNPSSPPPANNPQQPNTASLVLMVSDINGWTAREQALADALTLQGASVVGFDWLRYLWAGRSAEQGQIYLERTIRHYLGVRQQDRIRLIGIGAGGGALPVLVNRLAEDVKPRIQSVALLYPAADAYIATPLPGWSSQPLSHVVVRPELEKLPAALRCFASVSPNPAGNPCEGLNSPTR